jgi:streptomycin 6-kinase
VTRVAVPPLLARNVVATWGAPGRRWLADLPTLVAGVARDWDLELGAAFPLSYHWVVAATRTDGTPAVLKLGVPGSAHLAVEAATLQAYDGHGAVRLLAYDPDRGALLLERADPGTPATTLVPDRDTEATAAAVAVLGRLHRVPPPSCALPDLETQRDAFTGHLRTYPGDDPLPRHLVDRAGRLFDDLCASATQRVVLHGDLHHDNILAATREPWLAIDPHGAVGDPGYDLGALLYNPDPARHEQTLLDLLPARLDQLAAGTGEPAERVLAWAFVKAVLSEVWTAQDGGTPGSRALDVALHLLPDVIGTG